MTTELLREKAALKKALENIVNALGPALTGGCKENKCEGCKYEMDEALRIAKDALGAAERREEE